MTLARMLQPPHGRPAARSPDALTLCARATVLTLPGLLLGPLAAQLDLSELMWAGYPVR